MEEEKEKIISAVLREAMEAQDLSFEKLAQATGISERYLNSLLDGRIEKMPALPYVRGYIKKIGEILKVDSDKLWEDYLTEHGSLRRSGREDKMPHNRFVSKTSRRNAAFFGFAVLAAAALVALRFYYFNNPRMEFISPPELLTVTDKPVFTVAGRMDPNYKLTLKNEEIFVGKDGTFSKEVFLEPGFNTFVFTTQKFLDKKREFVRQVFYDPESKAGLILPQENFGTPTSSLGT